MKLATAALQIPLRKRAGLAERQFRGLASTFSRTPDRQGDRVAPGAFAKTIAAWKARGQNPPLLWDHMDGAVIGAVLSLKETAEGLEVVGELVGDDALADKARELLLLDTLSLSIGALVPVGTAELYDDGTRVLHQLDLLEVSIVAIPADAGAVIREAKSYRTPRELQDALRNELGFSKRQAEALIKGGWKALQPGESAPAPSPDVLAQASRYLTTLTQALEP